MRSTSRYGIEDERAPAAGLRNGAGIAKPFWRAVPRALALRVAAKWVRHFPGPSEPAGRFDRRSCGLLALLALVAGALLYPTLSYPLLEPDEGRYAEVAREMLLRGDWVVPTLNHGPFYDKPPLFYWLVAGSFRLFGMNEAAARMVPASAAFLTVLGVFVLGRRILGTRGAFLAGLALALMTGFVQCGRIVILDSLLTCFVTFAVQLAYLAVRGQQVRWSWWLASAVCCALGVLAKGPVALVLLGPPLVVYGWLNRRTVRVRPRDWAAYVVVIVCLVAPWYAAIIARDPHFAYHFFIDQHLVRFLMKEYHVEPVWYYVPVLLVACLPWSLLLIPLARFLCGRSEELRVLRPQALGFFVLWAGWCVLFFSVSRSKLPPYILPATPALALIVGCYLDRVLFPTSMAVYFRLKPTTVPRVATVLLAGLWLAVAVGGSLLGLIGTREAVVQGLLAGACAIAVTAWGRRLSASGCWLLLGAVAAVVAFDAAQELVPAWSARRSPLTRSEEVRALVRGGAVGVACYGGEWGSVPFYVGRDDSICNCSETPGATLPPFLREHPRSLLVVKHPEDLERLREAIPPGMRVTRLPAGDGPAVALVTAGAPVRVEARAR